MTRTNVLCRETEMYFTLQSWVCSFKQEELCGVTKGTISSYIDCHSWREELEHNSVLKHRYIIVPQLHRRLWYLSGDHQSHVNDAV